MTRVLLGGPLKASGDSSASRPQAHSELYSIVRPMFPSRHSNNARIGIISELSGAPLTGAIGEPIERMIFVGKISKYPPRNTVPELVRDLGGGS